MNRRVPLLVAGMASLLLGAVLGLARAGWGVPLGPLSGLAHGPLMVNGFFGTLIALERAVALEERWAYGAPALFAASAIAFVVAPLPVAVLLATSAALVFVAASVRVVSKQVATFTVALAMGAVALLAGNVFLLLGRTVPEVVLAWGAFFVLTISAERLELGRVLRPSRASTLAFVAAAALVLAGGIATAFALEASRVFGAGAIATAAWLAKNDVARRTVRTRALPRFSAAAMIAGYVWLAIAGALLLLFGLFGRPLEYDAVLHALLLGFVMSMVFGHAPIVLPAVTGFALPYRPRAWVPLAVLHGSLLVRVGGDLAGSPSVRALGAMLNVVAVVAFLASTAAGALGAALRRRIGPGGVTAS